MNDRQVTDSTATPERFLLRPWVDPAVEARGFAVTSIYTETVLLPILGPSTVLCLRRLGSLAAARPNGTEVDTRQLAKDLGVGDALSRNSQITRTLSRLCDFGMARWLVAELDVRTAVAPAPEHQLRRLSPELIALHHCMVRQSQGRAVAATDGRAKGERHSTLCPQTAQPAGVSL